MVLMPPPAAVAVLKLMKLWSTLNVPSLAMPPPTLAELPLRVQPVSAAVPKLTYTPPPRLLAELPLTVQRVIVMLLVIPSRVDPRSPPPLPAELPEKVESVMVAGPLLFIPPPNAELLLEIVQPEIVMVASLLWSPPP